VQPWSCDTFVAMPDATPGGHVLVGKNSDRPVSDSQPLRFHSRRPAGGKLALAHVDLEDTGGYAHLGGSPYWCWGHELGMNEWGVVIGNEALFTRDWAAAVAQARAGSPPEPGLLGMELVRLGLERGRTAAEAMSVICSLVDRYGQWGSAVPGSPAESGGAYDNSYLLADAREAWVLETSGRRWVSRRIRQGTWAISNQATIRTQWDRASADLAGHAVDAGWWNASEPEFDFARAYTDPGTPLQVSHIRLQRSRQLLRELTADGGVDVDGAKRILRDHYEDTFLEGPYFNAALPDFLSLCMHSHPAGFTWGNTASSAVFVLPTDDEEPPWMWWTPVTPCTGVYLPVFVASGRVPEAFAAAGSAGGQARRPEDAPVDTFAEGSYWWLFRRLLDRVKGDERGGSFTERQPIVRAAFDELERRWAAELARVRKEALRRRHDHGDAAMAETLAAFTDACAREAAQTATGLIAEFGG